VSTGELETKRIATGPASYLQPCRYPTGVTDITEIQDKPNTVLITLDNGVRFHFYGLFAATILRTVV
jgi:hypothetical protein